MKLKRFKEKDNKRIGILIFTIVCISLVSGAILYRTFAIFEVKTSQNVIKGTVQDPGNIYFAFYVNDGTEDIIQKEMPNKNYVLDEEKSYCGVNGERDNSIKVTLTDEYGIYVTGVTTSRTKCNLYFVSGAFILGKPIKAITSGEGLYEVTHEDTSGTINDTGFKETEFRYAGNNPNNYVTFNDEKWRIIGLVNVMTSDNTVEQRVKITRSESIGNIAWNTNNINDWTQASLQQLLNTGNYYTKTGDYSENGLTESAKQMIEEVTWNIGSSKLENTLSNNYYTNERGNNTPYSHPYTWIGKIALFYPSDYAYATSGSETYARQNCLNSLVYNWEKERDPTSYENCVLNDWLWDSQSYQHSLTSAWDGESDLIRITSYGDTRRNTTSNTSAIKPTLYLKQNVKIVNDDQDGSYDKPYNLKLVE